MRMFKRITSLVGGIILVIVFVAAAIWVYYGGWTTIVFSNPEQGGEILVYKEVIGDYSNTKDITEEVYNVLKDSLKIETCSGFGIFFDNPDEVKKDECRSEVGCILESKDIDKIPEIQKYFRVTEFPVGQFTSTDFPYKGELSFLVGMWKVYPQVSKMMKDSKNQLGEEGPIMEIYNMQDSVITYRLCGKKYPGKVSTAAKIYAADL